LGGVAQAAAASAATIPIIKTRFIVRPPLR
jgi:hypothetical protein